MRRIIKYQRKERYKKLARKKAIISAAIIITIVVCSLITTVKLQGDQQKVYTKTEVVEDSAISNGRDTGNDSGKDNNQRSKSELSKEDNAIKEEKNLDNSGYIVLEKDPNADDVMALFHTTEKLLKNETSYPVRTDGKKVVYLTFDDGPSTTNTPKVLDTLKENNIKATFFIMGRQVDSSEESKEILKRTAREGHAIGNHTYGHDYGYLYPGRVINPNNFMADVEKCDKTLKNALGKDFSTRAIRFPGGYWSWEGRTNIRPIIDQKGYAIIDWNTLSEDAEGKPNKTAQELTDITRTNVEKLGTNADSVIVLMHDTYGKEETAKSLQGIINIFKEKGFEFRTMK